MKILLHVQHQLHILNIGTVNNRPVSQISFAFGTFLCKNMAFVSMFSFDFSCSGKFESFFGTGIGFHFWHFPAFLM